MRKRKAELFNGEAITVVKNDKNQYEVVRLIIEDGVVRHRHSLVSPGYTLFALDAGEKYLRERLMFLDNGVK